MTARAAPLLLVAALALLCGCRKEPTLASLEQFAAANRALAAATTAEECRSAAARYEELLASGGENGAVLHALGNARFRAGEKGRAIAAWQRAIRLRPRDPWLRANLDQARAGLPPVATPLADALLFWRDDLAAGEQAWLLSGSVAIACLALLASTAAPRTARAMRPVAWVSGGVALLAAITFGRTLVESEFTRHAAIAAGPDGAPVVVRKGDGESFEPALTAPLPDGSECTRIGERGEWRQIELPGGLGGWVPAARLAEW